MSTKKIKGKLIYETSWTGYVNMEPKDGKRISVMVVANLEAWWIGAESIVLVDWTMEQRIGFVNDQGKWNGMVLGSFNPYMRIVGDYFLEAIDLPYAQGANSLGYAVDIAVERGKQWERKLSRTLHHEGLHVCLEEARQEKKT